MSALDRRGDRAGVTRIRKEARVASDTAITRAESRIARPTIHFAYARFHGAPCSGRVRCMRS